MKAHKEIDKIESIVNILKERLEQVEVKIESRDNTFNDRSEKWQQSEKGVKFEEVTSELSGLH